MSFTLRRACAEDAAALDGLMRVSNGYRGEYAPAIARYGVTAEMTDRDVIYLAEDAEGRLAGFYSLIHQGEPELDLMFVADDRQGSGLGAILFNHMAEQARALGIDAVKVISNPPAEGFYRRMGCERIGTKRPGGLVTWDRPILYLRLGALD